MQLHPFVLGETLCDIPSAVHRFAFEESHGFGTRSYDLIAEQLAFQCIRCVPSKSLHTRGYRDAFLCSLKLLCLGCIYPGQVRLESMAMRRAILLPAPVARLGVRTRRLKRTKQSGNFSGSNAALLPGELAFRPRQCIPPGHVGQSPRPGGSQYVLNWV